MKITSVKQIIFIEINGKKYLRGERDFTESVHNAEDEGVKFETEQDVFDWVEIN